MRYIFYDTETTGLSPERERIIELAAYDPERDAQFVSLIHPGRPIPAESSAIHGITDEMVASAPSFTEVWSRFTAFCEGDVVLIAHNNDTFDQLFLKEECARNQVPFLSCAFLDSLKWARRYRPDLPRYTLQFLRESYGIVANQAHRALDDVIVLHQVFMAMTDDLAPDVVFKLMQKKKIMRVMPFGKHQGTALRQLPKDYLGWLRKSGALEKPENSELLESLRAAEMI